MWIFIEQSHEVLISFQVDNNIYEMVLTLIAWHYLIISFLLDGIEAFICNSIETKIYKSNCPKF